MWISLLCVGEKVLHAIRAAWLGFPLVQPEVVYHLAPQTYLLQWRMFRVVFTHVSKHILIHMRAPWVPGCRWGWGWVVWGGIRVELF